MRKLYFLSQLKNCCKLKLKNFISLIILILVFTANICSQTPQYYNSNTGSNSNAWPFAAATGKQTQFLLLAGDLNKPSSCPSGYYITNVWFRMVSSATGTFTNLTIKLGQTAITTLPTGVIYTGALTTVYSATTTLTFSANGWTSLSLATPFLYNTSQSLVVDISHCGYSGSSSNIWNSSISGFRRTYINGTTGCVFTYSGQDAMIADLGVIVWPSASPLSGNYTIDNTLPTGGTNFNSFTAAISTLNCLGVGTGGVTFNVSAGQSFTEIPPSITATGTSANTITFQKSGVGANPIVQSSASGSGTVSGTAMGGNGDAFFKLVGTDYITFDGIDVKDAYTTAAAALSIEYGFLLVRSSATDGCKNVTIRNCNIQLNYQYSYAQGIGLANINRAGTVTNPTSMAGRHENIFIYNNTIVNVYDGITITGYADPTSPYSLYENNIQIGVGGANTIRNNSYVSGITSYGIYAIYADSLKIANNNFSSGQVGAVQANLYTFWSIYLSTGLNSNADIYSNTFQDTSFATTTQFAVIGNAMGGTGTNNTVNIYNNTIQNCIWTTATTGTWYGIYNNATTVNPQFLNVYGNIINGNIYGGTSTATASIYYMSILGNTTVSGSIYNIYNNTITNNSRVQSVTGAGATYYLYIPASALTLNIYGNNISNNLSQTTGILYCLNFTPAPAVSITLNCYNNIINNNGYSSSTTTGTFYGIYDASLGTGGGTVNNYNNVVKNINLTNRTTGSLYAYYLSSSYGTHNINQDTVANNTAYYIHYGIYVATPPPNVNITNNNIYGLNNTSTAALYPICKDSYTASSTVSISNNNIYNITLTTAAPLYPIYSYYGTTVSVNGNNIYNISSPTSIFGIYLSGYSASPFTTANVYQNNINNITSTGSAVYGLSASYLAGLNAYQNNIYSLNSSGGAIFGMYIYYGYSSGTTYNVYQNNIYSLSSSGAGSIYGIYRYANILSTNNIYKNNLYNLSSTYSTGSVYGIYTYALTAAGTTFNTYNNFISDLRTTTSGTTASPPYLLGIYHSSSTVANTCNDYYNTIYLNGTSSSASFSSACMYVTDNAYITHDMRNNILVNNSTPGSSGRSVAFWRSASTNLSTMYSANSNNNCFYAGTPGTSRLIYYDPANSDQTLASFQQRVDPRDNSSVTESPPFINVGATPYDLHINTTVPTQLESGAGIISAPISITGDYESDPRYPNIGYPIGSFTPNNPDIGADEFGGIGNDITGPSITYTTLSNTVSTANRSFTNITATDRNGIETTSGIAPRCYYKKSSNMNVFISNVSADDGWKWVEANGIISPFDFTIDYSKLYGGSANAGDQIMYFVVAQDMFSIPNVSIKSGTFALQPGSVNLTSSAFPIGGSINNYMINSASPLAGDYTVGLAMFNLITGKNLEPKEFTKKVIDNNEIKELNRTKNKIKDTYNDKIIINEKYIALSENGKEYKGSLYAQYTPEIRKKYNLSDKLFGNYANISSAIGDLNAVGISSSVRFLLLDASYGATGTPEIFPLTLGSITGTSPSSTITIQPQGGVNALISGDNTTAIIDINGGDYITIDGRPNGSSAPKQLTIRNTSATANVSTIRFINDASYNTVQYATIEGCGNTLGTSGTIYFANSSGTTGNDYNTIQYNDIRDRSDAPGTPTTSILNVGSLSNDYINILNNNIYNTFNATATCADMYFNYGLGKWTISGNSFYQTSTRSPSNAAAYFAMILTSVSDSFTVSNNYLGGTAPLCGGTPLTYTDGAGFLGFRFWQTGNTNPTIFSGNTITNIDYSTTSTGSAMFFRAADVATNPSINVNVINNVIGSASGQDAIILRFNPITSAGSPTPTVIAYGMTGAANTGYPIGTIQNNIIGGITITGTGTTSGTISFNGIYIATYCQNINISGNTIGNSTAQNIQNLLSNINNSMYGIYSATSSGYNGATGITNNIIQNLYNSSITISSSSFLRGIYHSGSDSINITGNTIKELSSMSQYAGTISPLGAVAAGIISNSASTMQNISGNTITGIRGSTTAGANTYVEGIGTNNTSSVGSISRNRIYDITNTSAGASAFILGINNNLGTWTIGNNQLTLTNGETTSNLNKVVKNNKEMTDNSQNIKSNIESNKSTNRKNDLTLITSLKERGNIHSEQNKTKDYYYVENMLVTECNEYIINNYDKDNRILISEFAEPVQNDKSINGVTIYGICDNAANIGNYFYNSVYVGGSASSGILNSYCLYRGSTQNLLLQNNLFYNGRINSGTATGKHYAIGTPNNSAITSDYNSYITADASVMGYWNAADQTFAQWKVSTAGDRNSYATTASIISATNLFNSIANGNLNIQSGNSEAWIVSGKGIQISGQTTDFDGIDTRAVLVTDGVTDIGSDEFSAIPPNCPAAIESAPPADGTTTSYSLFGRTLCNITWGTGGTSYPSNINLYYYSGVTPPGSTGDNAFSYCQITPTGTLSGTTYDITNYFTDAETYTIVNPTTDMRLAKYNGIDWYVYLALGTGNWETELNWAGKWAKVRGLDGFSLFAFSDISGPLPVNLSSFNSIVNDRDVKLNWISEKEYNNSGYEIQRIKNTVLGTGNWLKIGFVKSSGNSSNPVSYSYEDKKLNCGKYNYRLKQIDNSGSSHYFNLNNIVDVALPTVFKLSQNYPNPFNPATKIDFELPFDSRVRIVVYDMLGREVKILLNSEAKQAGFYTIDLNANNLSSGTYFYRMVANTNGKDIIFTKKMVVLK